MKLNPHRLAVIIVILINILIASQLLLSSDIKYFPDNSRDMLLMREMTHGDPIMLIGPRSGGIPGVFHGPGWLYLNLPAFIAGGGSPIALGTFWLFLYIILIAEVFIITKKLFKSDYAASIAAIVTSANYAVHVPYMYNPHGAILLGPLLLYSFVEFLRSPKWKPLLAYFVILGFMIQFQMAFGIPILIATTPLIIYKLAKQRRFSLLWTTLGIFPGISTYILFELKYSFLQTKSVIAYLNRGSSAIDFQERFNLMLMDGLFDFNKGEPILIALTIALILYGLRAYKQSKTLFAMIYLFIGFWIVSLLYRDHVWQFYHWPLHTMAIITLVGVAAKMRNALAYVFLGALLFVAFSHQVTYLNSLKAFSGKNHSSWLTHEVVAKDIKDEEFGYFVFMHDLLGYTPRYAVEYIAEKNGAKAHFNEKLPVTYAYIVPTTNLSLDVDWWLENRVNIEKEPNSVQTYPSGLKLFRFELSEEEVAVPPHESLSDNLLFR